MADQKTNGAPPVDKEVLKGSEGPWLRRAIRNTLSRSEELIQTSKAHSPLAEDKLERVDQSISDAIHVGYQGVRSIAVRGHPAVILGTTGLVAAAASAPFGIRSLSRNTVLAVALAAVMIYPDHLAKCMEAEKTEKQ